MPGLEVPSTTTSGPALPWGRGDATASAPAPAPAAASEPVAARAGSPQAEEGDAALRVPNAGDRIEVLWEVQGDDGTAENRWWGAVVERAEAQGGEQQGVWRLRYDALDEFEEEVVEVVFEDDCWLRDVSDMDGGQLRWKFEGEQVSDWEDDLEVGDEMERTYTTEDLAAYSDEVERQIGMTVEDAMLQELNERVPSAAARVDIAARFRDFVDQFKERIDQRLAAAGGGGFTVTGDVVREITSQIQQEKDKHRPSSPGQG